MHGPKKRLRGGFLPWSPFYGVRTLPLFLLSITSAALFVEAWAQPPNFEGPFSTVNLVGTQQEAAIATDGQGTWVIAWSSVSDLDGSGPDTNDEDIVVVRSTDNGETWQGPVVITQNDNGEADRLPSLATDGSGNWVVVWRSLRDAVGGDVADNDILFSTSTDNGVTWTTPALVQNNGNDPSTTNDDNDTAPRIVYGGGQWLVVWQTNTATINGTSTVGTDGEIAAAVSLLSPPLTAADWSNVFLLSLNNGLDDREPAPGFGNGVFLVVWNVNGDLDGAGPDTTDYDIVFARSPSPITVSGVSSHSFTSAAALNSDMLGDPGTPGIDREPAVTTDGAGNWMVTYRTTTTIVGGVSKGSDNDIAAAVSTDNGGSFSSSKLVNSYGSNVGESSLDQAVWVETDGYGNWVVLWLSDFGDGTSGTDSDVWASWSANGGTTWSTAQLVTVNNDTDGFPKLVTDRKGRWVAAIPSLQNIGTVDTDGQRDIHVWRDFEPRVLGTPRFGTSPTNAATVKFFVAISDNITGLDPTDLVLVNPDAGISGASIQPGFSFVGPGLYLVTVNTGTGDGALRIDVVDDDTITGSLGVPLGGYGTTGAGDGSFTSNDYFVIDKTPPTVTSITPQTLGPTNVSSLDATVTFSESVSGFSTNNIQVNLTGTAQAVVSSINPSGPASVYTVTLTGVSGDGTVSIEVLPSPAVTDAAGNTLNVGNTGPAIIVDNTAPTVVLTTTAASPTNLNPISCMAVFSEAVSGLTEADFVVTSATVQNLVDTGDAQHFTFDLVPTTSLDTISVSLPGGAAEDLATNPSGASNALSVDYDGVPPSALTITPATLGPTNADAVPFTVTFNEPVLNFNDETDVVVGHTGTSHTNVSVLDSGDSRTFTVTVSGLDGDGTFTLSVNTGSDIVDAAGNPAGTGVVSPAVVLDNTAPTVASIEAPDVNPTNAPRVTFYVNFSESVLNVQTVIPFLDFALAVTGNVVNAYVDSVQDTGDNQRYRVEVVRGSGNGTIRLDVVSGGLVQDMAGNLFNTAFTTGPLYTISQMEFTSNLPPFMELVRGGRLQLNIAVSGGVEPKSYQWYFEPASKKTFSAIPGANTDTLVIDPIDFEDAGHYYCEVADGNETLTSNTIAVTVLSGLSVGGCAVALILAFLFALASYRRRLFEV